MHKIHSRGARALGLNLIRQSNNTIVEKTILSCSVCKFSSSSSILSQNVEVPSQSEVVICGGGVIGASVAYHLAERGWTDVTVLEQGQLTCGTTWHSAGLVGRLRASPTEFKILDYSMRLYDRLEKEGHKLGWKQCGSVSLARTKDRLIDLKRKHAVMQSLGVETHMVSPKEAQKLCPLMKVDDIVGAIWIPHDGVVTAPDVCMTLSKIAKEKGVKFIEGVRVESVETKNKRVTEVHTSAGSILCDYFVNAAGQWARELGKLTTPHPIKAFVHSCEHYYLMTKPQEGIDEMMPVVHDYDGHTYFREWNGGMLSGGFEPNPKHCFHKAIPANFEFQLLPEDWDHFQMLLDNIIHRMPLLKQAEVNKLVNGPASFTPDSKWLLGRSPKVDNYFLACGMNATGIAAAGGVGKEVADLIVDGKSRHNLWAYDPRRFVRLHNNKKFLRDRMTEAYANISLLKFPKEEYTTGRKLRCSPLHARLEASGAVWGETMAYERAMYFQKPDDDSSIGLDTGRMWTWHKPVWFESVKEEYWACKERISIMDMSSFTKIEVKSQGNEATEFLQYLCSNNIDCSLGTIVHTGMQNEDGGFENDVTVNRVMENKYFIICLAFQHTRAMGWLTKNLPANSPVQLTDITSMFAGINLIGPHAHQLLADVAAIKTSKTHFRPMSSRLIDVGHASGVRAMRLTHTGEDGFILYIPSECALHVYDALMLAGKDYGIRNAGYYSLRHLRIENFFALWGLDLDEQTSPLECGRGFRTKMEVNDNFLGKEALIKQQNEGVKKRFVQFMLDDFDVHSDVWPWGGETIYRDGQFVGMTTTCGYGFSLDKMVCTGFIGDRDSNGELRTQANINEWVLNRSAKYEIDIAGIRFPARPGIYTPKMNVKTLEPLFVPAPTE